MHIATKAAYLVDNSILQSTLIEHMRTSFVFLRGLRPPTVFPLPDDLYSEISNNDRPLVPIASTLAPHRSEEPLAFPRMPSASRFSEEPVPCSSVLRIIRGAFGADEAGRRRYPSAGALYPIEVFLLQCNPDGSGELDVGAYHFLPYSQQLEQINSKDALEICRSLFHVRSELDMVPSFALVYQINFIVALAKYQTRGYRFGLMEAGSMYQLAEQIASDLSVRSRVWGGFSDGEVSRVCGTNPTVYGPCIVQLFGQEPG